MHALRKSLALVLSASALVAFCAHAQNYPAKPVQIIVPFAPGGGSDFIARFAAQRLTETLGSQVIVENRPGVRSKPDGYTLTLIASSYTVNAALYPLKYLIAPKGVPAPIVERINAEVNKMLQSPETAKQLETDGVAPAGGSARRFGEQIRKEIALWRDVVAKTGVEVQ
jgi:tripartite-type tricarboxylate transporter receptor subunit TctC